MDSSPSTPGAPRLRPIPLPAEETLEVPPLNVDIFLDTEGNHIHHDFSPLVPGTTPVFPSGVNINSRPATEPPVTTLFVYCPQIREIITVFVDETNFVSVLDVILRIHHHFHGTVNHSLFSTSEITLGEARLRQRCAAIVDDEERETELHQGIKVVDILDGMHFFGGLARTNWGRPGRDVWELRLRNEE